MGRVDYRAYLVSRKWGLLRRRVRERAGGICERCHHRPMRDAHHLTYQRLGCERLEDLLGVCRGCHSFLGGYSDKDPLRQCVLCDGLVEAGDRYCASCSKQTSGVKERFSVTALNEAGVTTQFIPDWASFRSNVNS